MSLPFAGYRGGELLGVAVKQGSHSVGDPIVPMILEIASLMLDGGC